MENQDKGRECYNCYHFRSFYVKGTSKFDRAGYGACILNKPSKVVKNCESCECWEKRETEYYRRKKRAATSVLKAILNHLTELRQIFEENFEEQRDGDEY